MLISEIYHKEPQTIDQDATIGQAVELMLDSIRNGFIVTNKKNQVVGVLSLQDIAAEIVPDQFEHNTNLSVAMYKKGFFHEQCSVVKKLKVKELMRTNFTQVDLNTNTMAIAADFLKNDLYIVPVIDHDKLIGIVTRTEIKKALAIGMGLTA